ncbi:MAG: PAS domain S-box protein [Promethearchaeota archaeon]|nr:MAG: PAS domain S-box protein [Candidatus Lokiarchaeota archaeon]
MREMKRKNLGENLKEKIYRYENLLENIPETVYSSLPDETSTTLFISKKWEDWTGIPLENYFEDPGLWIKTVHPSDRQKALKAYRIAKDKNDEFLLKYRIINQKSGEILHIRDHGVPVFDKDGNLIRYDGIMTNITDIVLKDKKLEESEKKYRHLFQNSPYAVGIFNPKGILIDINESANDIMSVHTIKDLTGRHYKEIWGFVEKNKPLISLFDEKFQNLIQTEEPLEFEFPIYLTLGGKKWVHINASVIKLDNEKIFQFIIRDITESKNYEQRLEESNQIFEIFDRQSFISMIILQDNIVKYCNEKFLNVVGYSKEEVENWNPGEFIKIIHPEYREFVKEQIIKKQRGDKDVIQNYEFRGLRKNGETYWGNCYTNTVMYNGKISDLVISLEVTERKEIERKLKESEKKYRTIFNSASDLIMIHDLHGRILEANQVAEYRLKYTKEELLNMKPVDFVSTKYIDEVPNRIKSTIEKGLMVYESEHISKEGEKIPVEISLRLIEYEGKPAILNISRDITDRKKAEKALKESEEKFRTIAEQSVIGIKILLNDKITYLNKAYAEIIGYPYKEIKNWTSKSMAKAVYGKDLKSVADALLKFNPNPENPITYISRILTSKNQIKWIESTLKSIKFKGKDSILGTIIDVTKQKEAEMNLKKISKLKTDLLRRTSHELKTPLVSIKGFTNLLLDIKAGEFDEETIEIINEIKFGTERLENLVKDILETAKLESDKVKLDKKYGDLSFLIRYVVKSLKNIAESRNQTIELNIHDKLITYFEKEKIFQVLENLLSNAIKYTPPNGTIEIATEVNKKKDQFIVKISDTGIGLSDEDKKRLFTQFGKIERYGRGLDINIEGSGLGLYISKQLVELHGGKVWAESEGINMGSTFYFSLPIIKSQSN